MLSTGPFQKKYVSSSSTVNLEDLSKGCTLGKHTSVQGHTQGLLGSLLWAQGPAKPFACWKQLLCSQLHSWRVFLNALMSQFWTLSTSFLSQISGSCLLQRNIVGISSVCKHSRPLRGKGFFSICIIFWKKESLCPGNLSKVFFVEGEDRKKGVPRCIDHIIDLRI